jgi:hypothetical protein
LADSFEFEKQARLTNAGLAHDSDNLAMAGLGQFEQISHCVEFAHPSDKLGEPASCSSLQTRSQQSEARNFINLDRVGNSLNPSAPQSAQLKEPLS